MSSRLTFSPLFNKKLKILKQKNTRLLKQIQKALALFSDDPRHPSLRRHKLKGHLQDTWSISVNRSIRLLYIDRIKSYYFFDLGTHKEVYGQ